MKKLSAFKFHGIFILCLAISIAACDNSPKAGGAEETKETPIEKAGDKYCTFATRSNRCNIAKHKNLCFKCTGNACPDLNMKQVYLNNGGGDSCLVSLGNKISDCGPCAQGDTVVVLQSISLKMEDMPE